MFLMAGCGVSGSPGGKDSAQISNDVTVAARGRASLVATFKDTPWRLPPVASPGCIVERRKRSARAASDEPEIYCSLNRSAMTHLLRRLDQGLGAGVTPTQKSCVNAKITRDQIAVLLSAELGVGADDLAATEAEFDDKLASVIRQCASG